MTTPKRIIVFLGPPGSGKGTQGACVSEALQVPAISTGEILRRESRSGSRLGKTIDSALKSGQLVGDGLMNELVTSRLAEKDCELGCVLDGYPRTVQQAGFLDNLLEKLAMPRPVVFDFGVSIDELIERLSSRRQCAQCGRIYSVPKGTGESELQCEYDGAALRLRADDHPAAIRERLRLYQQNADALVAHYRAGDYFYVEAGRTPAEVTAEILGVMADRWTPPAVLARAAGQPLQSY